MSLRVSGAFLMLGCVSFFFQAEDGIRDLVRSRGLGDVYKRQDRGAGPAGASPRARRGRVRPTRDAVYTLRNAIALSLIHI